MSDTAEIILSVVMILFCAAYVGTIIFELWKGRK